MKSFAPFLFMLLSITSCSKNDDVVQPAPNETMYFPSNTNSTWETVSLSSLGWNENALQPLKDFLIEKNTKSFIFCNYSIILSIIPSRASIVFLAYSGMSNFFSTTLAKNLLIFTILQCEWDLV